MQFRSLAHNVLRLCVCLPIAQSLKFTTNVEENSNAQILHICPTCVQTDVSRSIFNQYKLQKMKNLIEDKMFVNFKNMTNEERGSLISSHKKELEDYFCVDMIIHKYGQQPQNENQMLSYKVEYSGISELINIVEFRPRS